MKNIFLIFITIFTVTACDHGQKINLYDYVGEFADAKSMEKVSLIITPINDENINGLSIQNFDENIKMMCKDVKTQDTVKYAYKEEYPAIILDCMAESLSAPDQGFFYLYASLLKFDDGLLIFLLTDDKNNFDKDYCYANPGCQIYKNAYNKIEK
ncbi:MAG: hypothetical protein LBR41_02300 [Rickettsiales bacterium]|jgi:hypothetical protein|nr:hypothetical protein [Rickettsiales bacterium]